VSAFCNQAVELTGLAGNTASPVHRRDPRAKVLGFIGITLVAVTASVEAWPIWVACALVLAVLAAVAGVGPRVIWQRARLILPLVLFVAVFVPFVRGGETVDVGPFALSVEGLQTFLAVSAKATIGIVSAILLGATTSFPSVLAALESMRMPRLLVLIAAFTYRYLFVIVDEVQRMRAALAARAYRPRNALHAGPVGRAASALFLRTYARGERVYLAMLARGYDGTIARLDPLRFARADIAFLAVLVLALVPLRIWLVTT
jgi:cobalt/nickel transport system permease protein